MLEKNVSWTAIAVANAAPMGQPAIAYPCRGSFNRYTGCIGGRRCRGMGVPRCILGRWPDERITSNVVEDESDEAPSAPRPDRSLPAPRPRPVPAPVPTPAPRVGERSPASAGKRRPVVGIVHADRNVWQFMSRHLTTAGYDPIWLATLATATAALEASPSPDALLVDPRLEKQAELSLTTLRTPRAPVLQLPTSLRERTTLDRATRMALVWLTVQLQAERAAHATA